MNSCFAIFQWKKVFWRFSFDYIVDNFIFINYELAVCDRGTEK